MEKILSCDSLWYGDRSILYFIRNDYRPQKSSCDRWYPKILGSDNIWLCSFYNHRSNDYGASAAGPGTKIEQKPRRYNCFRNRNLPDKNLADRKNQLFRLIITATGFFRPRAKFIPCQKAWFVRKCLCV